MKTSFIFIVITYKKKHNTVTIFYLSCQIQAVPRLGAVAPLGLDATLTELTVGETFFIYQLR